MKDITAAITVGNKYSDIIDFQWFIPAVMKVITAAITVGNRYSNIIDFPWFNSNSNGGSNDFHYKKFASLIRQWMLQ